MPRPRGKEQRVPRIQRDLPPRRGRKVGKFRVRAAIAAAASVVVHVHDPGRLTLVPRVVANHFFPPPHLAQDVVVRVPVKWRLRVRGPDPHAFHRARADVRRRRSARVLELGDALEEVVLREVRSEVVVAPALAAAPQRHLVPAHEAPRAVLRVRVRARTRIVRVAIVRVPAGHLHGDDDVAKLRGEVARRPSHQRPPSDHASEQQRRAVGRVPVLQELRDGRLAQGSHVEDDASRRRGGRESSNRRGEERGRHPRAAPLDCFLRFTRAALLCLELSCDAIETDPVER
eukprot:31323-Pelagococcus_subviridis.AAC.27